MLHRDSEMCVGYFFVDILSWERHPTGAGFPSLKELGEKEREQSLGRVAEAYYSSLCKAVRKVDPNHLIFGDRYNGKRGIPASVLKAMAKHVDVSSVQYFCEPLAFSWAKPRPDDFAASRQQMIDDLAGWQAQCRKPVLVAGIGNWCATDMNSQRPRRWQIRGEG